MRLSRELHKEAGLLIKDFENIKAYHLDSEKEAKIKLKLEMEDGDVVLYLGDLPDKKTRLVELRIGARALGRRYTGTHCSLWLLNFIPTAFFDAFEKGDPEAAREYLGSAIQTNNLMLWLKCKSALQSVRQNQYQGDLEAVIDSFKSYAEEKEILSQPSVDAEIFKEKKPLVGFYEPMIAALRGQLEREAPEPFHKASEPLLKASLNLLYFVFKYGIVLVLLKEMGLLGTDWWVILTPVFLPILSIVILFTFISIQNSKGYHDT